MEENRKLTYEELEQAANQLSEQVRGLYMQLQQATDANFFKRIDYLFKVVENSDKFNPEFVMQCTKELESTLTLPEPKEENKKE